MSKPLIYLASPYTCREGAPEHRLAVQEERYRIACQVTVEAIKDGVLLYSPIAATHALAKDGGADSTWDFWKDYDSEFIRKCDEMWVLKLEGWRESVGVTAEIDLANHLEIPYYEIDPAIYGVDLDRYDDVLNGVTA